MGKTKDSTSILNGPCVALDLTSESDLRNALGSANTFFQEYSSLEDLQKLESETALNKETVPLLAHLAIKLAKSKRVVANLQESMHISVVFAVYKEHNRILEQAVHPHGENFLVRKIAQLEWLFSDFENLSWDMTVVDDGCPEKSGKIALEIIEREGRGGDVQVLFLQEAIERGLDIAGNLKSTDESRKGGSIHYGLWNALQNPHPNHLVLFTDADLSTHLGQIGLLIDGIVNQQKLASIGSRREAASIVIKEGTRNTRGKLFIYLWKRVLNVLPSIIDTQCGFKMFHADLLREILHDLIEKGFAFDIELLLKSELHAKNSIAKIPIAWIDSEAASTTTDLQPYLTMLQSMVSMYRKYLPTNISSDNFAQFIENLTESDWESLLSCIPDEIAKRDPQEFETFEGVTPDHLQSLIR